MPNWCDNELTIKGPKEDRERFLKFATGSSCDAEEPNVLDFNKFIPYPKHFRDADEAARKVEEELNSKWKKLYPDPKVAPKDAWDKFCKENPIPNDGYNSGGYYWCCANWGTKWNAHNTFVTKLPRSVIITFDTAWSPPRPVIRKMSEMFPTLTFRLVYYERGSGFSGKDEFKNGLETELAFNDHYRGHRGG